MKNYLGGHYYFTADEVEVKGKNVVLVESKHSKTGVLPSLEDIKDGLLKMILFTNLNNLTIDDKKYNSTSALKLTVHGGFKKSKLSEKQKETLNLLDKEAMINKFQIKIE